MCEAALLLAAGHRDIEREFPANELIATAQLSHARENVAGTNCIAL